MIAGEMGIGDVQVVQHLQHDVHACRGLDLFVLRPPKGVRGRKHHVQHHPARPHIRHLATAILPQDTTAKDIAAEACTPLLSSCVGL